jgi:hypothetical protein
VLKVNGGATNDFKVEQSNNLPYQFIRVSRGSGEYVFETDLKL